MPQLSQSLLERTQASKGEFRGRRRSRLIATANYVVDTISQRQSGIYYTPDVAARVMAEWAVCSDDTKVLEPCFGSGVFLAAVREVQTVRHLARVQTYGVELMKEAYDSAVRTTMIRADQAILGDFLGVKPFPVDAVIGNPPYVRLRNLPDEQAKLAIRVTRDVLGAPVDKAGSVWMAFVLHATRFLGKGGRIALVLPYEITYVRYARTLWRFLGSNFGNIRIARVKERLFPDILQEAIILFADDYGATTDEVTFEAYQTTRSLAECTPAICSQIALNCIVNGDRPFLKALLPDQLNSLLEGRLAPMLAPVREHCVFNIGYVSGDKGFFHPDNQTIEYLDLPETSLVRTISTSRELKCVGIRTSSMPTYNATKLFYPGADLSYGEKKYILKGELDGVNRGYKCSRRTPWYKVPDVRVPDLILSVFRDVPSLLLNDAGLTASNSLLCGFLRHSCNAHQFMAAWYTSLTLLFCELQVHSLGGGVLILIPGEVATVKIPKPGILPISHIEDLDLAIRSGNGNPYRSGDKPLLIDHMKLTHIEVDLIREGIKLLSKWRTSAQVDMTDQDCRTVSII